ncbi:antiviral reverse transcriptase Drt3b [Vibrio antiquarius]|uniref:antiviral reverse transcriptase Drt3b n=1 Tax=Vibrio antiquarius (strain Ex25) TaxID=150340 RepID=UPI002657D138|nr:antiviral reverse transcriptase Drt3b [Vibrio antiquarius]MCR9366025.1 RNA-directed DNA polymerase [Vibrio antiquarius]
MSKVKIDKHDHLRVMLTDTLPYEVPITFLNEGAYFYLRSQDRRSRYYKKVDEDISKFVDTFFHVDTYTVPYNYRISKNSKSKRLLSVPHPTIQRQITKLYRDYDSLITELCSRSPISLRAPHKIASRYYEKELASLSLLDKDSGVETEKDAFEQTSIYASSYFTYKKYNFLYKFYDSYESHRIEKKFDFLTKFDISKCFHNIYTPTLTWAVKGRAFSKQYSDYYSFDLLFKKIMEDSNDLESSGILVGPEFSRIYAEVILQNIDLNIIRRLKNDCDLYFDSDYTIRRYVDDYFLYTKSMTVSNTIMEVVVDELEKYKLFINESKTEYSQVPFITGLTIAKMDCKEFVNEYFDLITKDSSDVEDIKFISSINPSRKANSFIRELKRLVKVNNVSYESLTGYALGEIRRRLFRLVEDERVAQAIDNKDTDRIMKLCVFALEISFFVYSMDIRVRTTYIITQLVVGLNNLTERSSVELKDVIRKKIYDESMILLSKMKDKGKANSIETLNLLISIKTNFNDYPISQSTLLELFEVKYTDDGDIKKNKVPLGYFQIMVLSWFNEDSREELTEFLQSEVIRKIEFCEDDALIQSTELTCMLFDSFSNPYFTDDFKNRLIDIISKKLRMRFSNQKVVEYLKSREWFFTWKKNNLAQVLMKKELRSPY